MSLVAVDWISIRNDLIPVVQGAGIEIVHSFPRVDDQQHTNRWLERMRTTSKIDAWTILRTSAPTVPFTTCEHKVLHQVLVRGMLQHSDEEATQDDFDRTVDAVLTALFKEFNLSDAVTLQGPAQLAESSLRQVGDTVVHFAEITTVVEQVVNFK
jgi:hypothetical protein